jgi:PIN domain nuclease of toxin-antitoxin system
MTHLLDTCTWLRAVGRLGELNAATRAVLADSANLPFGLSAISIWEICTKFCKKPDQLSLTIALDEWLKIALHPRFIRVIPVDAEIARLSNELPGTLHEDPADRMIVATARREGLRLVTSDGKILAYPHVQTFDTR